METLVKEICRQEQIVVKTIPPLQGGQLNQVFLVNGAYVIRVGEGEAAFLRLQK
jgi:hypothetical protein